MASTRAAGKKVDKEAQSSLERLTEKYGAMLEAVKEQYPHAHNPLTLSVLITAGGNPMFIPAEEPFDDYGYYQMDWQLGARGKYPWPSEQVKLDAFAALELEGTYAVVRNRR